MNGTVEFQNSRGINLVGDFYPSSCQEGIIMCHGLTGDRHELGRFDKLMEQFNDSGFNVLSFDFSGCGESDDDSITIEKEIDDLKSAIKFMKSKGCSKIGLFGHSLGGLVSLYNSEKVSAIVLTAPITAKKENAVQEMVSEGFIRLENGNFLYKIKDADIEIARKKIVIDKRIVEERETINTEELLAGVKCPVLIFHGAQNSDIPLQDSFNGVKYLNEESRLYIINGMDNDFNNQIDEVAELAMDFFKKHL